jgi:ABC-type branched-subunit amino acid transport system substrate-binding protein
MERAIFGASLRYAAMTLGVVFVFTVTAARAQKAYGPGVSDTEIKIGQTIPYSGPVSAAATIGRTELAYFEMVNEKGGINGRKVTLISLDDGYSPPKTLEQVRRLVEKDDVLAIFNIIGTPTSAAVQPYLNEHKVPQIFIQSGATRFADPDHYPWTISIYSSYRAEAQVYGRYVLAMKPNAKVGVLYQNDDFGKDYLAGFKEGLGDRAATMVVAEVSYEASDPTVDTQVVTLQGSGADVLLDASSLKFAAQTIRKAYDMGWKPLHFLNGPSTSIPTVLKPAGLEKSIGIVSARYAKTPGDPQWEDDPDYRAYLTFMKKHYPAGDPEDSINFAGYSWAYALAYVLEKCGDNLTRENLMRQATHLQGVRIPMLLPGITLNSSPTDYRLIKQFIMHRFDGKQWEMFGEVLQASAAK